MSSVVNVEGRRRIHCIELLFRNFKNALNGLFTFRNVDSTYKSISAPIHVVLTAGVPKENARFLFRIHLGQSGKKAFKIPSLLQLLNKLRNAGIRQDVSFLTAAADELERPFLFHDGIICEIRSHRAASHERGHGGRNHRLRTLRLNGGGGFINHHQGATRLVEYNLECRVHFSLPQKKVNKRSLEQGGV